MKYLIFILVVAFAGCCDCQKDNNVRVASIDSSIIWKGKERIPMMYYFDNNTLMSWIVDLNSGDTVSFSGCHGTKLSRSWHSHDNLVYTTGDNSPAIISNEPVEIKYK